MSNSDMELIAERRTNEAAPAVNLRLVQRMAEVTRALLGNRLHATTIGTESNPLLRPVDPPPEGSWHY